MSNKKAKNLPEEYEPTLNSAALTAQMKKELTPENSSAMNLICMLIGKDGLKLDEACKVANIEVDSLKQLIDKHPIIAKVIAIKESEYKHMLLRQMSVRARSGDDKVAQWLLETRYPEEFGPKKKGQGGGDNGMDFVAQAVSFIQENGDNSPIVKKTSTILVHQVKPTDSPEVKTLKSFLN